jgi:Domain of unknown function (DUF4864)
MSPIRLAIALVVALACVPIPESMPVVDEAVKSPSPMPRPELTPDQVVDTQLVALQFNDRPTKDAGIATTFRFASPDNRKTTGPVEKFALIVKGPAYRPLINHRIAGYGLMVVKETLALIRVTVVAADGQAIEYEFRLSKDPASNCWFTDGVIPIPAKPTVDPSKVAQNSQPHRIPCLESFLYLIQPMLSSQSG